MASCASLIEEPNPDATSLKKIDPTKVLTNANGLVRAVNNATDLAAGPHGIALRKAAF